MKFFDKISRYLRRHGEPEEPSPQGEDLGISQADIEEDLRVVATRSGIADVDPQSISHVAGEGIDLDRDLEAHDSIKAVRDRMPGR
ncbi:MAG: hypothetical protein HOV81_18570 [Kofleriaceae bacterium]|nr:hypothetical protein [Kofleriaceae bacterium]